MFFWACLFWKDGSGLLGGGRQRGGESCLRALWSRSIRGVFASPMAFAYFPGRKATFAFRASPVYIPGLFLLEGRKHCSLAGPATNNQIHLPHTFFNHLEGKENVDYPLHGPPAGRSWSIPYGIFKAGRPQGGHAIINQAVAASPSSAIILSFHACPLNRSLNVRSWNSWRQLTNSPLLQGTAPFQSIHASENVCASWCIGMRAC